MPPISPIPSFDNVCSDYANAIRKRIRYYIRDVALVKDLHQEILVKVWMNLQGFDPGKGSLHAWIVAIANNTCIDHLRAIRGKIKAGLHVLRDTGDQVSPEQDFGLKRELLGLALRLPIRQRDILIMVYFRGYTQNEIAHLLKIPLGTVKTRQRSAILALRKIVMENSLLWLSKKDKPCFPEQAGLA